MKRKALLIWFAAHLALCCGILLLPRFLQRTAEGLFPFSGCVLHDLLHVYCPFCGGTRSLTALLHASFGEAFRFHALVPVLVLAAIFYDLVTFYHILKGKKLPVTVPRGVAITVTVAIVGYWILRNLLLIGFGIDPVGDLLPYWHP